MYGGSGEINHRFTGTPFHRLKDVTEIKDKS
jgi:hypothetical protein